MNIHILSDEEFDNLGYEATKGSDVSNSLGFGNPDTQQAYVRYSASPELMEYLVNHESDELAELSSTHEDENGIRHKNLGRIFTGIATGGLSEGVRAIKKATAPKPSFSSFNPQIANPQGIAVNTVPGQSFTPQAEPGSSLTPGASGGAGGDVSSSLGGGLAGGVSEAVKQRLKGTIAGRNPQDILRF
jgi:hypothetical protein